ncbi:type II toxin-antitoxin system RelE/ParE family toxin [Nanoarchaeota archaeon]
MMYELTYSKNAFQQLNKLDEDIRKRIIKSLERCRIRPEHFLEKQVGSPLHKLRIGDYRAIVELYKGELRILVIKVGHRRNIYKKS